MTIIISFKNKPVNKGIAKQVSELIHAKLSRFKDQFRILRLVFDDINGPKGGIDTTCTLSLSGPRLSQKVYKALGRNEIESLHVVLKKFKNATHSSELYN